MKRKFYFLIIVTLMIIFLLFYAKAEEPNKYNNLIINITFNSSVLSAERTDLEVDVSLFPLDDARQKVIDFVINGPGAISEQKDSVKYEWSSVNNAEFGWNSVIKTSFYMVETGNVEFPLRIEGFDDYKKATDHIDINDEITKKANELVAGKTDFLEAVHEIADYVYNTMTYDSSYKNSEQKASWVMQNKKGVCDEYTVLFLALVRSLGIPGRYVSGVAYSNIEKDFGNHAWAEVYNGKEWIPFDTTFGQFGWLDATHVALSKTSDSRTANAKYRYTSYEITTNNLDLKAKAVSQTNELNGINSLEFGIEPLKPQIGTESFIPIKVSIKNKNNYYLPLEVHIHKGLDVVGKNSKHILIPPLKTKTAFFVLQTPTEEDNRYVYTATVEARTQINDIAITSFDFANDYDKMSLDTAESLITSLTESDVDYRYDASINCMPSDRYYKGEEIKINCIASSNSNAMLDNLNMCVNKQCYKFDLPINGKINKDFIFASDEVNYIAKLTNSNITRTQLIPIEILEKPDLQILDIEPKEVDYNSNNLSVNIETKSICRKTILNINGIDYEIGDIDKQVSGYVNFRGRNALSNKINIIAGCSDLRGNIYRNEKSFDVQVKNLPWYAKIWQKIILFLT